MPVEAPRFELHVSTSTEGEPERVVDGEGHRGDPDLVMHFAVLHEHGRPVVGPPPAELFPAVSRPLLLKAFLDELALIYKSLEAVKTLGALPPQDELLEDTIQIVDQSLNTFVH